MCALGYVEKYVPPVATATRLKNWGWNSLTYVSTKKPKKALGEIISNDPLE
jgi:hypothetical protein